MGDLIHADYHGAVVIPLEIAHEVAAAAEEIARKEEPMISFCQSAAFSVEERISCVSSSARMPGHTPHRSFEIIDTDGTVLLQPIERDCRMRITLRQARGPYKEGARTVDFPGQERYIGDFRELAAAIRDNRPLKYSYDYELAVHETILRASGELA